MAHPSRLGRPSRAHYGQGTTWRITVNRRIICEVETHREDELRWGMRNIHGRIKQNPSHTLAVAASCMHMHVRQSGLLHDGFRIIQMPGFELMNEGKIVLREAKRAGSRDRTWWLYFVRHRVLPVCVLLDNEYASKHPSTDGPLAHLE